MLAPQRLVKPADDQSTDSVQHCKTDNNGIYDLDPRLCISECKQRCISKPEVISKITEAFELNDYSVEFDDHYRCRDCTEDFLGNYDNA